MTGTLLGVIISFCSMTIRIPEYCIREKVKCAALNKAFEADESKATKVVAACLIREN